eukprot:GHVU01114395.1.p1 GENE.GHVU01114395.1~~GHVU01114395.1.p1  ORF type:complete len:237 (+),score=23.77 GHVU01114395.1:576-1286(+)
MADKVKDSTSCIFPALLPTTPYELFQANVAAVKVTSKKWKETPAEAREEYEAFQLILATNSHGPASGALLRVYRQWNERAFLTSDGNPDPGAWCQESWRALGRICQPMDRDAREIVRTKLQSLPFEARQLFGSNVPELLNHFRVLRSDATKFKAGFTEAALADLLIRAAPEQFQPLIRLTLEDKQEDSTKVLTVLERLTKATGAYLGSNLDSSGVKDKQLYYVQSYGRPATEGPVH